MAGEWKEQQSNWIDKNIDKAMVRKGIISFQHGRLKLPRMKNISLCLH